MAEHAFASPSSAERWLECTAAPAAEALYDDEGSEAAAEGTRAHDVVDQLFAGKVVTPDELHPPEMLEYAAEFVGFVRGLHKKLGGLLLTERRVLLDPYVPGQFGRADVIIAAPEILHVIDFKYGKGKFVSAFRNPQMRLYALGAYELVRYHHDIEQVTTQVWQPRLENFAQEELTLADLLQWADDIQSRVREVVENRGVYRPGDEVCGFCRARFDCRARAAHQLKVAGFRDMDRTLTDAEIAEIVLRAGGIRNWLSDIESEAAARLAKGHPIIGLKLVEGRSNRRITDEAGLAQRLLSSGEVAAEEIYKPPALRALGELEKAVGKKKFNALSEGFVEKPPGKPTLVSADDSRPEYNPAQNVFTDRSAE